MAMAGRGRAAGLARNKIIDDRRGGWTRTRATRD